jgi:formamidopyrimidine-DNA glycosylase
MTDVPELPDIQAYLAALGPRILEERIERVRLGSPFFLRTVDPPLEAVEGQRVTELRRIGKRIAIGLEDGVWLVLHLMIAGRLHWQAPGAKLIARRTLAAIDFAQGSLTITEAGSKRRASLHLVRGLDALEALDPGGLDVMTAPLVEFRARLSAENRTLKRALTDPRIVSGIGNAYSDEILHAARLSPIAMTGKLTDEQWHTLHDATMQTLDLWLKRFVAEAAAAFPEKVTAFRDGMAVHGRFGKPCPRCGAPVQRIRYADNETNYCAPCQTQGRLLADRSLSRLLGRDWPKTLDELETLKRR